MKTIEEILNQEAVYLEDVISKIDVFQEFSHFHERRDSEEELLNRFEHANVLFAYYSYENYTGEAFVLFEKDGKLFEVNASHCSCYGLEGQWEPEEVTLEELEHRLTKGSMGRSYYGGDKYSEALCEFIGVI